MPSSALHVARTGLEAQDSRMRVIANNLANVGTTAFKRDRANFATLAYQDMRVAGQMRYYSYSRSDAGVQQIWRAVRRAIEQAETFIYLEDQYLVNLWVGQALARKLATAGKDFRIVILALHPDLADIEQVWPRRRALLAPLIAADPGRSRWQVFTRSLAKDHPYVHSKTWIFDDELVITGSANVDRRGYTYNSEADVVVAPERDEQGSYVDWAAIIAGVVLASAISLLLLTFGSALGLSFVNFRGSSPTYTSGDGSLSLDEADLWRKAVGAPEYL